MVKSPRICMKTPISLEILAGGMRTKDLIGKDKMVNVWIFRFNSGEKMFFHCWKDAVAFSNFVRSIDLDFRLAIKDAMVQSVIGIERIGEPTT